jgi:hypothetical protein
LSFLSSLCWFFGACPFGFQLAHAKGASIIIPMHMHTEYYREAMVCFASLLKKILPWNSKEASSILEDISSFVSLFSFFLFKFIYFSIFHSSFVSLFPSSFRFFFSSSFFCLFFLHLFWKTNVWGGIKWFNCLAFLQKKREITNYHMVRCFLM